jgi:O-antigen ligase
MQTIKYYIKNTLISFLCLCILSGIFNLILDNNLYIHEYLQCGIAILIGILGLIIIGYYNALSASKDEKSNALFLHIFLILCLFITDSIWSESSFLTLTLRNLAYFILLEFGVFIYMRRRKKLSPK